MALSALRGMRTVSQINGCAYCIDMHSRDLIKEGLAVEKLVVETAKHRLARPGLTRPSTS